MLKGILHQEVAVRMLRHEIERQRVPRTMLFYGPDGSGKFLAAVEVVRILNCREGGEEGCACPSCVEVQKLISNDMLVLCRSNLRNSFELWKRFGLESGNRQYFITDLRRFLFSISHDERYRKELERIAGLLRSKDELETAFSDLIETIIRVIDEGMGKVITIDQIRGAQRFLSHKSGYGRYRALIVDGAEAMNEEAQNSFLKISEDTPEGSCIILTARSRDGLKPTVVSRSRLYMFKRLNETQKKEVIAERWHFSGEERNRSEDISGEKENMKGVLKRLGDKAEDLQLVNEIADEINRDRTEEFFFTYIMDMLKERLGSLRSASVKEVSELELLLKKVEKSRRSILYANANREIAVVDFLLNNIGNVVKYCSTGT